MSGSWSSNDVIVEYRDLQANAMAVDCNGQYALLAGKRTLALVDLDNPIKRVRRVPRQSKWEISAVQWNPHADQCNMFVSACNQRADICIWADSTCYTQASLKAHTRVISDLDWSPEDVHTLATCSVDTFTYLWDIRDCRKPSLCLQAVAGVSQVKWNKVNSNMLATTHDGDIRIWDPRKGTSPVQYIAGHLSKIHGLDWNHRSEFHMATSSQDGFVKFWDVTNPRQPEMKLSSGSPVWRARYTPFGHGMITVVVPQLRRGENSLFLWTLSDTRQPVHTFVGHTDVVLEFQWRTKTENCLDEQQLVTWSKDQSLRLWKIDAHMQKSCGHETEVDAQTPPDSFGMDLLETKSELNKSRELMPPPPPVTAMSPEQKINKKPDSLLVSKTPPQVTNNTVQELKSPQQPRTLQQEFSLVNIYIPNVKVDEMDAINRTVTVSAMSGKHIVNLTMNFPDSYPLNVPPTFQFGKMTTLDKDLQTKLIKVLRDTSLTHVKHNRSCIEPCLRQLVNSLDALTGDDRKSPEDSESMYSPMQANSVIQPPSYLHIASYTNTFHDSSIPFPRTSGARFCATGFLVCFTRKSTVAESVPYSRRTSSATDVTPRALAALSAFGRPLSRTPSATRPLYQYARSPPSEGNISISNYYQFREKKRPRPKRLKETDYRQKDSSSSPTKKPTKTGPVIIYDIAMLLPIQKQLAEKYVLDSQNITTMCQKNAALAASLGRKDLVQAWTLAIHACKKSLRPHSDPDKGAPWPFHPFGRKLLKALISHYSQIHDVQTLAMLCCSFGYKNNGQKVANTTANTNTKSSVKSPSDSTVANHIEVSSLSPAFDLSNGWNNPVAKLRRSNSWSDMCEDYRFGEEPKDPVEVEKDCHDQNSRFLEDSEELQYDQFRKSYADILYRWNLLNERSEVLKYVSVTPDPHKGVEFNNICQNCRKEARGPQCWHCKGHVFLCSICRIVVKGVANFCLVCGHGGHSDHMLDWFRTHDVCPTGCGCRCIENNSIYDDSKTNT